MTKRFVGFGELLLRLDAKGHERFLQAGEFRARYTGAEANVAVSLARFGWESWAVSKVPAHEIGQAAIDELRRHGVRTEHVVRGGGRLGLLYVEHGTTQRPSRVVYDREDTAFRGAGPEDYDWPRILEGKDWLHISGTAAAMGPGVLARLEEALRTARRLGVTVSCDPNYRSKLWSVEEAGRVLSRLFDSVDVFLGGAEDLPKLFGIIGPPGASPEGALEAGLRMLTERFGFRAAALTMRHEDPTSDAAISGMVRIGDTTASSRPYPMTIVDRIGGGDAFAAGAIHAIASGWSAGEASEFAAAAASLKHSIPGDVNLVTVEEVQDLAAGQDGSRVAR